MPVFVLPGQDNKDGGVEPKECVLQRDMQEVLNRIKQKHHPWDLDEREEETMGEGDLEEAAIDEDAWEGGQIGVVVGKIEGKEPGCKHAQEGDAEWGDSLGGCGFVALACGSHGGLYGGVGGQYIRACLMRDGSNMSRTRNAY